MAALHRLYFRAAGMANRLPPAIPFRVRQPPEAVSAPTPVVEDHARAVILGGEVGESMEMPMKPYISHRLKFWADEDFAPATRFSGSGLRKRREKRRLMHKSARNQAKREMRKAQSEES